MLIIMRGWQGSGKSTLVKQFVTSFRNITIYSTDEYWIRENGEYLWDSSRLGEAHQWNENRAKQWFEEHSDEDVLIIDNTNITLESLMPYVEMAQRRGHVAWQSIAPDAMKTRELFDSAKIEDAILLLVKHWQRNLHGVPLSTIMLNFERWEESDLPCYNPTEKKCVE